jgi:hypothetical protein
MVMENKIEIDWLMANATLSTLRQIEKSGIKLGGLVQDWEEILDDAK